LSLEKTEWQDKQKFEIYSIPSEDFKKVSLSKVFAPPGIALLAKRIEFKPDGSKIPISIIAFIKYGKNSLLLNNVWNRLKYTL
jgi:hypothetical protein